MNFWQTSKRRLPLERPLVMAILNVTPDSFSDGGRFATVEAALRQAAQYLEAGADIIDVGGESTRPQSARVPADEEIRRVRPVVEALAARFDAPVSIDTSKAAVARAAVEAGAEIVNDVSGLRFDPAVGAVAGEFATGLVLMHLRGEFETMHAQEPVAEILPEVARGFRESLARARATGVADERIALDVGLGFGKTLAQNLELIARLGELHREFAAFPLLVGASRKSFIGKTLGDAPPDRRLYGSLASAALAVWNGARIVRVHDVRETVETLKLVAAVARERKDEI